VISDWLPYCGRAPEPAALLTRWNLDPLLIAVIALATLWAWRRSERSEAVAGASAMAVLLFVSPLCALTSALFSARSGHHVLILAGLAPLLAMAVPRMAGAGSVGWWTGAGAVVLWAWHLPAVYAASLSSDAIYWLMQLALLGTATGFWVAARRAGPGPAILACLANVVQTGLLGALLTVAPRALYAPHALTTAAWGLSPIADQQLGGLIMWVPGAGLYLAAALILLRRLLAPEAALSAVPALR
jgi:putative membrane protein